jgi:hypothetical protein
MCAHGGTFVSSAPTPETPTVRCHFCGKAKDQVAHLVQGPNTRICSECVALCCKLIGEDVDSQAASPAPVLPTQDEELTKDIAIDIEDVLDMAREVVRFSRGPWNERGGKYVKLCATLLRQQVELSRLREEHEALKQDQARLRASLEAMRQENRELRALLELEQRKDHAHNAFTRGYEAAMDNYKRGLTQGWPTQDPK